MEQHYCPNCGMNYYCLTVKCDKPYKTVCSQESHEIYKKGDVE